MSCLFACARPGLCSFYYGFVLINARNKIFVCDFRFKMAAPHPWVKDLVVVDKYIDAMKKREGTPLYVAFKNCVDAEKRLEKYEKLLSASKKLLDDLNTDKTAGKQKLDAASKRFEKTQSSTAKKDVAIANSKLSNLDKKIDKETNNIKQTEMDVASCSDEVKKLHDRAYEEIRKLTDNSNDDDDNNGENEVRNIDSLWTYPSEECSRLEEFLQKPVTGHRSRFIPIKLETAKILWCIDNKIRENRKGLPFVKGLFFVTNFVVGPSNYKWWKPGDNNANGYATRLDQHVTLSKTDRESLYFWQHTSIPHFAYVGQTGKTVSIRARTLQHIKNAFLDAKDSPALSVAIRTTTLEDWHIEVLFDDNCFCCSTFIVGNRFNTMP